MRLRYHKTFQKQVKKLPAAQKRRLKEALEAFVANPCHPDLYNNPLAGPWNGHRSISFGGDWRAHYKLIDENTALFVAVGTHGQLYG